MDASQSNDDLTRPGTGLTPGTRVQQFKILRPIGAGGMGEVFLAEDSKLGREVALKFLPAWMTDDEQFRARFTREAQAAAGLKHPNIVVVYDVGEFQGRPYYAMEHVEGTLLRDLIRQRQLDLSEAVELISGVCEGLQAAHDKQVVHRDIKPSNIVIDAYGRPKILDFGLATVQGTEQLTRTGSTLGTIQYMSPEQAEGKPIDSRSDLFSLGAMLYEMIAGRSPFLRDNDAATLRAITIDTPEPLARHRSGVSENLQRVVSRLLARDPAQRYQSAADVLNDLKQVNSATSSVIAAAPAADESIVVVPFENLGGDSDNEYFSDGLTEEIITDLGKIGNVRVISRKSSMQLKGTDKDIRSVGQEFAVTYVLTGSVRRMGENIRVNCELAASANERQIWSERYTGTTKDVFDIQEEIARAIAAALKVKLSASEESELANRSIENLRAYDLLLRSRQETERWTRQGLDKARELLTEAIRLDPGSAALRAGLGYNYYNYVNMGFHQEESIKEALNCLQQAFELDPDSTDALRLQGIICVSLTGEARKGIRLLEQVLEKSPNDSEAMFWASMGYGFTGRTREATELSARLMQIEPLIILSHLCYVWGFFINGDFDRARVEMKAAYEKEPNNALVQYSWAQIQLYCGAADQAAEFIRMAEARQPLGFFDRLVLMQIYAVQGNRERVEEIVTDEFRTTVRRDLQYPWHYAVTLTLLGDYDEALEWLGIAIDNGFGVYRFLEELDPYLEPLRSDVRFKALVERARAQALP